MEPTGLILGSGSFGHAIIKSQSSKRTLEIERYKLVLKREIIVD